LIDLIRHQNGGGELTHAYAAEGEIK